MKTCLKSYCWSSVSFLKTDNSYFSRKNIGISLHNKCNTISPFNSQASFYFSRLFHQFLIRFFSRSLNYTCESSNMIFKSWKTTPDVVLQSTLDFRNLQIVKFLDLVKFLLLTKFLLNKTLEIVKFLFMFESPIFRFSKVFLAKLMKFSNFLMKFHKKC